MTKSGNLSVSLYFLLFGPFLSLIPTPINHKLHSIHRLVSLPKVSDPPSSRVTYFGRYNTTSYRFRETYVLYGPVIRVRLKPQGDAISLKWQLSLERLHLVTFPFLPTTSTTNDIRGGSSPQASTPSGSLEGGATTHRGRNPHRF